MKSLHELAFNYRNACFSEVTYAWHELESREKVLIDALKEIKENMCECNAHASDIADKTLKNIRELV